MTFTPFETARLRLRPQEARDAGFALCIWGDPITGKYLSDPVLDDIDDLNEYMELLRNLSDSTDCYYVIAEDKVTHQPIGTCCAVVKDGGSCWDIGYCIHPTCWRKGYARSCRDCGSFRRPYLLAQGLCQRNGKRSGAVRCTERYKNRSGRCCRRKCRFLRCDACTRFHTH